MSSTNCVLKGQGVGARSRCVINVGVVHTSFKSDIRRASDGDILRKSDGDIDGVVFSVFAICGCCRHIGDGRCDGKGRLRW